MNEHAVPLTPVRLQYFWFAPLPLIGQFIVAGHVFVASQLTWQPHEFPQFTVAPDGSRPMQVAVHLLSPQLIVPHAALPLHVCVHFDVDVPLQVSFAHAFEPVQVRVQSPVLQLRLPQTCEPLPPEQVSVQLPDEHVTLPHAAEPMHSTSQSLL